MFEVESLSIGVPNLTTIVVRSYLDTSRAKSWNPWVMLITFTTWTWTTRQPWTLFAIISWLQPTFKNPRSLCFPI